MSTEARTKLAIAATTRVAIALLAGVLLMVVGVNSAQAKHSHHRHLHAHHRVAAPAQLAEAVSVRPSPARNLDRQQSWRSARGAMSTQPIAQASQIGPMRYFGGPKSPMWRGPAEN